ncbi:MAG: hypothetical protein IH857_07440 [Deltaproteobacteria bacterium]|nr:hypothetical protein [Deltaproteobacteria bacterium]
MDSYDVRIEQLLKYNAIAESALSNVSKLQSAYVLYNDNTCLKVGIAGPRRGKGAQERLKLHYSSNSKNSVLARHMEVDAEYGESRGFDFKDRRERQKFLAENCHFRVLPLPDISRKELLTFEKILEKELNPRYKGRVTAKRTKISLASQS